MSFESVKEILSAHNYAALVGLTEDAWLEAKRAPYNFEDPAARYELAKDVAAFANGTGGFIIVGLQTEPDQNAQTEKIIAITACAPANFEPHRYKSLVQEYIHPTIQGLHVSWVPTNNEATQGLGIIEVPAQGGQPKSRRNLLQKRLARISICSWQHGVWPSRSYSAFCVGCSHTQRPEQEIGE